MNYRRILIGLPELENWKTHIIKLQSVYPNTIFVRKLDNENNVNKFCSENKINFILPIRYNQVRFLFENKINYKFFGPHEYDAIRILNNKAKFTKYFIENNLSEYIPKTYFIKTNSIDYKQEITFPCIYKPCIGSLGSNIRIIKNCSDLNFDLGNNYIIQEYVKNSNEYVGNFIVNNGKIIYSIILKETFTDDLYYKNYSAKNYSIIDITANITETFNTIFTRLNYTGMACADYKIINDKVIVFEINPRLGATIIKTDLLYNMIDELIKLNPLNV
jgi:glutathione synthase/RimK-type ligase-like ATP-grasp enzyme